MGIANLLDESILAVSPTWADKRLRARMRVAALTSAAEKGTRRRSGRSFDAAAKDRRTAGWYSPSTSANAETAGHLATIRNRGREMKRNSAWASKAERVLTTSTIGTGFQPKPRTQDEGLAKAWLDLWEAWSEATDQIDADGVLDFAGLTSLAFANVVGSGEVIVRRRRRRNSDGLVVPLQIQLLEADHLDETSDFVKKPGGARVVQGVEINGRGQRVAYHLFKDHPGELISSGTSSVRVAARDIAHVYRVDRVGQARGIPWGAPCYLRLKDYDGFMDAEILRQEIAATFVGFVHDAVAPDEAPGGLGRSMDDEDGEEVNQFEPGTWRRLNAGENITFGKPEAFSALDTYSELTLREIASGYGVTYEALSGDFSKVNFTSGRMGQLLNHAEIRAWRTCIVIPGFCRRVWRWFSEAAVLAGEFTEEQVLQARWTPPRHEMLDPVRETNAIIAQVQAGLISLSEAVRMTGRSRDEILEELAQDKAKAEGLDLSLSVFESGSGSSGQASNRLEAEPEKDDDEPEKDEEEETSEDS